MKVMKRVTIRHGDMACDVLIAETALQRMRGLLFRPYYRKEGMLFQANSVHTFFMRQILDVFFLDEEGRVIRAIFDLKPWRISPIVSGAKMVLEVPSGALGNIMVGTKIILEPHIRIKGGLLRV